MPSKLQFYQAVSEQAAKEITVNRGNWTHFLDSAARMYKYSFPDQLLIHAQRPDAIACASIDTWNDSFNRWVKRGTKGIALIDDTGSYPKLKYVFDVNDTESSLYNSRPVYLWEMRQEHREPVLAYLDSIYDDVSDTLADSFHSIAKLLAKEYYEDNAQEIRFCAEESNIGELDDFNLGVAFEDALANSIAYTLMSRCGFDTEEYFEEESFQYIFDFNTPDMVFALGTATNELSAQVLKDIELVIKKYERIHTAERSAEHEHSNNLHASRGLSPAGHQTERTAEGTDGTVGQIRENEESVSERPQDDTLQLNASERNAVSAPSGNGGSGENEVRTGDEITDDGEQGQHTRQSERPDGLDGDDERLESASGGNGLERPDLRLNETIETPPARIISEQGGVSAVNDTLSQVGTRLAEAISASSVTVDEVDSILRDGGNDKNSTLRIAAHFAKNLTPEENTAFLLHEYLMGRWGRNETPGGKGFQFGAQQTSVWFDETGITIGRGKSAIYAADFAHITWEQAAERVKALYDAGKYVSHDVLDEALYNESLELADDVVEVYNNISRGLSDIKWELRTAMDKEQKDATENDWRSHRYLISGLTELYEKADEAVNGENKASPDEIMQLYNEAISMSQEIPQEWDFDKGHEEINAQIAELLRDKSENGSYVTILNKYNEDIAALRNETDVPIRLYRNPSRVLANLEKFGLPPNGFPVADYQPLNYMRFITNDETDRHLARSGHGESKLYLLSHFLNEHTPQERVKFLKERGGWGGGTWVGGGWYQATPNKGIKFQRPGCEDVTINWNQVVRRTQELIQNGIFTIDIMPESIERYERIILGRDIMSFYSDLPEGYNSPFDKSLDFYHPEAEEWTALNDFLNDREKMQTILAEMQYIYVNTPEEDRYYDRRHTGFTNLASFFEGNYTLFPGLNNLPDPDNRADRRSNPEAQGRMTPLPTSRTPIVNEQLTLFDDPRPELPSAEEQKTKIEKANEPTAEANTPAVSFPITQDEIDALLLTITDEDKMLLSVELDNNPRSRESVQLIRQIYGGIEETIPRTGDKSGDLWILGENTGVNIVGAVPYRSPKDTPEPADTVKLPWAAVIKRIGELAADGRFAIEEQNLDAYADYIKLKAENPGCVIFYQVGDTFEFYQNDAEITAQILGISTITRSINADEQISVAVMPLEEMVNSYGKIGDAGYDIVYSVITPTGERSVITTQNENTVTEKAVEVAETVEDVYTTPINKIPYRVGDIVEAHNTPAEEPVKMVIHKIDENYVYYTFFDEPDLNDSPAEMFKERFEGYLDDGGFKMPEAEAAQITENITEQNPPQYKVGDKLLNYSDKTLRITEINDTSIQLRDTSIRPIDIALSELRGDTTDEYITLSRDEFERMLSDGELTISDEPEYAERFVVYQIPNRAGVYAVWDNENKGFYEDENGNISTFTVESEAEAYRDTLSTPQDTSAPAVSESEYHKLPILRESERIKAENGDAVVFYQVGGFYEMYNADAELSENILGFHVSETRYGLPEPVKMTGFPARNLESNRDKLVEAGYTVAVVDIGENGERTVNVAKPKADIKPAYNIGDRLEYNGTTHEIDRVDNTYVRLRNLGTLSDYPISDYVSVLKINFDRSISNGEIIITPKQDAPAESVDFDTVAQTVLGRVIQDADFIQNLSEAKTRASLRNPVGWAVEQSVRDHEQDEPDVWKQYFNGRDFSFSNRLQDYVLRQTWANRDTLISNTAEQPAPELDFNTVARMVLERVMQDAEFIDVLDNAQSRGAIRNPLNSILERIVSSLEPEEPQLIIRFVSDDDFSDNLFDFVYRQAWEQRPQLTTDIEPQTIPEGFTEITDPAEIAEIETIFSGDTPQADIPDVSRQTEEQSERRAPEPQAAEATQKLLQITPPPVFFVNWDESQFDFELNLYSDGDIIGYDKNGVEHALMRTGSINLVTSTGKLWQSNTVPGNIYEQIKAYENGEASDEQVRQNYLNELEVFTNFRAADLEKANAELVEILENGLFSTSEKDTISSLFVIGAINGDLQNMLSGAYTDALSDSLTLKNGEQINFTASSHGLELEISDRLQITAWAEIVPVIRSLSKKWSADIENEIEQTSQESVETRRHALPGDIVYYLNKPHTVDTIDDFSVNLTDPSIAFPVKMHLFLREFNDLLENDTRNSHFLPFAKTPQAERLQEDKTPVYAVGDIVRFDDYNYVIDGIDESGVQLRDIRSTEGATVQRNMSKADFEIKYQQSLENAETQPAEEAEQPRFSIKPVTRVEQISSNPRIVSLLGKNESATSYGIYDNERERYLKTTDERYVTFNTEAEAQTHIAELETKIQNLLDLNAAVSSIYGRLSPLPPFPTLESIETELDRKTSLMRDNPNYDKIIDAVGYWKTWRSMANLDGISADVLCKKLCEASDEKAVEWFTSIDWDNWRRQIGFIIFTDAPQTERPSVPADLQQINTGVNFRITDDNLGEGGAKLKFRNNLDAIKTLKAIEGDNRYATPEEQQILSRYVGWGGIPQAFDPDNKQWTSEYIELNAALAPEEFESARASTLNAHYTSPIVIKAIYEAIERMGFKSGNILEPSCGVGNFFGLLPDSMKQSKLYGVELDSVTARIAKQLYPQANIKETGYEKTDMPDSFFDLAIGNVPFGNYGVADKRYDKHNFSIHDYFFAKSLDQVRPGGVIAFVTSKFTLDRKSPEVRKYIAQRADLLGAVRLPNDAFLKNAGTETTMDILFLQKRDRPIEIEPDWIHLGMTEDGIPVNNYYLDNPEMLLGKMGWFERMNNKFGRDDYTCCIPIEGADLAEQLKTALSYVQGTYTIAELDDIEGIDNHAIPADPDVKNFSYTVVDETVYFRENSLMYPVDLPMMTLERIKGMIQLRDCVHELIDLQLYDYGEQEIKAKQAELSLIYDRFAAEYGLINSQGNSRAFNADNSYYLLSSLEILDEDGNLERKADMFTKRTIKQRVEITHVDTASEALAVSLGEKACVDLNYMESLTGFSREKLLSDLEGVIFLNIGSADSQSKTYVTADEYLSGNVRKKLDSARAAQAALSNEIIEKNITALEAAQPKDLEASEIAVRLGATWIDPHYVNQFMYELLHLSWRNQQVYQVKYHQFTGEWQVTNKKKGIYSDIHATMTYGTSRMNAYQIIDDTLNLRDVRVYDYKEDADGKQTRVLNKKETTLAQQKQEQIKQAFKDWLWKDPERRQMLVKEYNEKFNSVRPREYDGSHITFSGISPEITMRPHQLNAIAHILYGGNTLLAHVVGAGKTFEMVGAAMESKRLGLCQKSLFAVPNHLTEQWAGEFLRLYPSANILVATKKDFEMRNRKKFCAKIATGDYDAVIIGHSQLEKIPISRERQERHLTEQLWEIEQGIAELKESNGERFSIKQLEKTKKNLETRLAKLFDAKKRDDVVTFEQLGVDRLFVDEAHGFKNLFLYTKMRNVAGLSTSEAAKSSDLFMKCRYMDELTDNKGVIFATGTPISNSMTEMYTMQRYLQYDTLAMKGLTHFDCWASIFGETQTSIELAPEGTGYRARTRFAKFHNLPELMCMFKEVADIQTADMLKLPVPDVKFENIIVEPSELQKEMVQELSERAAAVHARIVEPHVDNMLKITTDGRKIGLDQRLINPLLPDFEGSKINAAAENIFRIWEETQDKRLTQLVFSDFSTPNKDGRFNIYDDIREKLLANGIPEHEVAFIHEADTETKKKELFAKVRQGKVRVLLGSTFKMGAGTNVQDRLIATHDVDCPWRPADLEQRAGRIVRQGNQNDQVKIFRYATNGTFDSYLWQTVENKQKFIAQIMSSKSPVRSCEDVDETALSYAEIKALCAGNPLIAEKMNLDVEVAKLRLLKADYQSQQYRLEDDLLRHFPEKIAGVTERIAGIEKDIAAYEVENEKTMQIQTGMSGAASVSAIFAGMTINGKKYKEKEPAAKALLEACKSVTDKLEKPIGEYMGFKMSLRMEGMTLDKKFQLLLRGNMTYQTELGTDAFGNMLRINNTLNDLPKKLEVAQSQLESFISQQAAAKEEVGKPFSLADELADKESRLALLNAELNIDGSGGLDVMNDPDTRDDAAKENNSVDDDEDYESDEFDEDDEPRASTNLVNPGKTFEYPSQPERQTVYAKNTKPTMMDKIQSFNAEKQSSATGKKPTEYDI